MSVSTATVHFQSTDVTLASLASINRAQNIAELRSRYHKHCRSKHKVQPLKDSPARKCIDV
jgi:hypothetical protein